HGRSNAGADGSDAAGRLGPRSRPQLEVDDRAPEPRVEDDEREHIVAGLVHGLDERLDRSDLAAVHLEHDLARPDTGPGRGRIRPDRGDDEPAALDGEREADARRARDRRRRLGPDPGTHEPQLDRDPAPLAVTDHVEHGNGPGLQNGKRGLQIADRLDLLALDPHDHVAQLDPRLRGRADRLDAHDLRALRGLEAVDLDIGRADIVQQQPEVRAADLAVLDEL